MSHKQTTFCAEPTKETRVHDTAVKEVVKPCETEEVQPIIHRDIYSTEIHQTQQPVYQKEILPTKVEERTLPSQNVKGVNKSSNARFTMENEKSSKLIEKPTHTKIVKPAIVQETFHKQIITEVQPVIYREVVQPTLIRETQNINEKIVEAPVIVCENDVYPAPPPSTTVHSNYQHTSFKDKIKSLFHATSGVDTVQPIMNTTILDSGSALEYSSGVSVRGPGPVVVDTPQALASSTSGKPLL